MATLAGKSSDYGRKEGPSVPRMKNEDKVEYLSCPLFSSFLLLFPSFLFNSIGYIFLLCFLDFLDLFYSLVEST